MISLSCQRFVARHFSFAFLFFLVPFNTDVFLYQYPFFMFGWVVGFTIVYMCCARLADAVALFIIAPRIFVNE